MQTEEPIEVVFEFAIEEEGSPGDCEDFTLEVGLRGGRLRGGQTAFHRPLVESQHGFILCACIVEGCLFVGTQPGVVWPLDVKMLTPEMEPINIIPESAEMVYTIFKELENRYEKELGAVEFKCIEAIIDNKLWV